jgi:pyridoxal phosphate enzyme (YggS family)
MIRAQRRETHFDWSPTVAMNCSASAVIERNLREIQERLAAACLRSGRDPNGVRLVAVTKTAQLDWIRALIDLGQRDLAENRPQQLVQRALELPDSVCWHMIGHLQRNKVDLLWPHIRWIHSVDSMRLLHCIANVASKSSNHPQILLEVNVSGEATKGGFAPQELASQWGDIRALQLPIVGLMTMAPLADDPQKVRPVFRGLKELRDRLREHDDAPLSLPELSMGMSGDFEVAAEEGATMVRIGSRIFQGLA